VEGLTVNADELLALIQPFGPAVEDGELVFATDLPPNLEQALRLLHTGVRALLSGRKWFGSTTADGMRTLVVELDSTEPIPPRIALLCVEGDQRWDRLALNALGVPDPASRVLPNGVANPCPHRERSSIETE
jgi:hypothetical protein